VRETARLERLREVVEGVLPEGTELVEARFSGGPLLTVLLDREEGPVDHEFCSRVASVVAPALEAEGYDGPIEVSSPGIERRGFSISSVMRRRSESASPWRGAGTSRAS
jgi:ribosome maturation factor RimP